MTTIAGLWLCLWRSVIRFIAVIPILIGIYMILNSPSGADIIVNEKESALVIPKDIIIEKRGRPTVYVVVRGFAQERRLQTGMENPDEIEVIEGLQEGDSLIIEGFETLRNQSRVNVLK